MTLTICNNNEEISEFHSYLGTCGFCQKNLHIWKGKWKSPALFSFFSFSAFQLYLTVGQRWAASAAGLPAVQQEGRRRWGTGVVRLRSKTSSATTNFVLFGGPNWRLWPADNTKVVFLRMIQAYVTMFHHRYGFTVILLHNIIIIIIVFVIFFVVFIVIVLPVKKSLAEVTQWKMSSAPVCYIVIRWHYINWEQGGGWCSNATSWTIIAT